MAGPVLRALLVCPGRGSYGRSELGYLSGSARSVAAQQIMPAVARLDRARAVAGLPAITSIDGGAQLTADHQAGENISPLIFASTALDFLRVDRERARIVAVLGNSMGWYSALFCAGALAIDDAFTLVQTMGSMARDHEAGIIGGQLLYPVVGDDWRPDHNRQAAVAATLQSARSAGHQVGQSIHFGGYAVLWGDAPGIEVLAATLPVLEVGPRSYPVRLRGHAAFHSPLLRAYSERGLDQLSDLAWRQPRIPLIDGRAQQWTPLSADPAALLDYTLRTQVLETYDFSASVRAGLREYAPDVVLCLGPGDSLGAAVAQVLIAERWQGIDSRDAFATRQKQQPLILSFARAEQRALIAA